MDESQELEMKTRQLAQQFIQQELKDKLERFAGIKSPLLIVGSSGLPLLEIAEYLAQMRICKVNEPDPSQEVMTTLKPPCGQCSDCVALLAGQSTRVKKVVPEGQFIKVEQSKDAMDFLSYKREKPVVLILHKADQLNVQAANALLKTLEEPPENCWILLTAASAKSIIATVRSRVQVINIPPLSSQFVQKELGVEQAQKSSNWLQGRLDRLILQEDFFSDLEEVEKWLGQVARRAQPEPLEWMDTKDGFLEGLEKIRLLLKDKLLNGQFKDPVSWIDLAEKIDDLEAACLQNVDRKLLMDHLYMAIEDL